MENTLSCAHCKENNLASYFYVFASAEIPIEMSRLYEFDLFVL